MVDDREALMDRRVILLAICDAFRLSILIRRTARVSMRPSGGGA